MPSDEIVDYTDEVIHIESDAPDKPLLATAYELLEDANALLPKDRQVSREAVREVVRRELPSVPKAYRSVINFLTTAENPSTNTPTVHTDLLHPGHPLSTVQISSFRRRRAAAQYFAADPALPQDIRPIIASAIEADPESTTRKFYEELLYAQDTPLSLFAIIEEADNSVVKKDQAS